MARAGRIAGSGRANRGCVPADRPASNGRSGACRLHGSGDYRRRCRTGLAKPVAQHLVAVHHRERRFHRARRLDGAACGAERVADRPPGSLRSAAPAPARCLRRGRRDHLGVQRAYRRCVLRYRDRAWFHRDGKLRADRGVLRGREHHDARIRRLPAGLRNAGVSDRHGRRSAAVRHARLDLRRACAVFPAPLGGIETTLCQAAPALADPARTRRLDRRRDFDLVSRGLGQRL